MNRITRERPLTPAEAAKYNKVREQVALEYPPLVPLRPYCPVCQATFDQYACPLHGRVVVDCSRCCYVLVSCCAPDGEVCGNCATIGRCVP